MTELKELLDRYEKIVSFTEAEIEMLTEFGERVWLEQDEIIFQESDTSDSVYLVISGAVELFARIHEDLDQTIMTVRPGGFIGALAMIDDGPRDVSAKAAEKTEAFRFDRAKLGSVMNEEQGLGVKLLRLLNDVLSKRLRIAMHSLRQNLEWTMQVSGLASLDISQLIADRVKLEIDLANGKQLRGIILRAEERPAGFELFLRSEDGMIHFIPYHAIVSAALSADALKTKIPQPSSM
jgi:CRP-like cAMP-binding protein